MITQHTVSPRGAIGVDSVEIGLGTRWAGSTAVCFRTGDHATIFIGNVNVRTLDIDRTRNYQPTGNNPRTGQPKTR
jgi:hypothetical protein